MLVSLNEGLLFCIAVGSNCKPCMTVTEYNTAFFCAEISHQKPTANAHKQCKKEQILVTMCVV